MKQGGSSRRLACAAALGTLLLCGHAPAAAQVIETVRIRAGLGVELEPEFYGDDSTKLGPMVKFSLKRGDGPFDFSAPDDNFGFAVVSGDKFSLGPAIKIRGSRTNDEVGVEVGKVPTTFEAGAFVEYQLSDSLRLRSELRRGIGGHKGTVGSLGADWVARDEDRYLVSVGPRLFLSDGRFQRAYFGVDERAAFATGLDLYRPGGGLHGVGAVASTHYRFGDGPWGLYGFARYERLIGDAADSPIIRAHGSRNQYAIGVALTHTFTLKL